MPEPFSVAGLAKEPNDEAIAPGVALLRGFALPLADDILGALGDITVQAQFPRMTMPCRFAGIGERRQGLAVEFLVNKRACALRLLRDTGVRTTGPFRAAYICLYAVLQPGVVGVGCLEKRFVIPGGPAVRITPPPAVSQLRLDFLALSTAGRTRSRDDRVPRVSPE